MRVFGLIGYPLVQSFSKKYFDNKFSVEGLTDCRFENFPIRNISELPHLIDNNHQLKGLAVTIPYKQQVIPYLTFNSLPADLNACNCIKITDRSLTGYNTDYIGFEKSFVPMLKPHHSKALVLGNGGATAAVLHVLRDKKISFEIVSRSLHNNSNLTYKDLTPGLVKEYSIIINTTPLGMYPDIASFPELPYEAISKDHLVYDLVYNPETTMFLKKARQQGASISNGQKMLEFQAEENWRIWNS